MSIGVAVIGAGLFVKEQYLQNISANPHLTLKAIYSRSLKTAQSLNTGVDIYSDHSGSGKTYHDLLLWEDISAVIIALPILSQVEFIEAALLAGKHVLSEKPIAQDMKTAERMIDFYRNGKAKAGIAWSVAENFRFIDSFLYGRENVQKLGRVLNFRAFMYTKTQPGGKYFETAWRKKPGHQGGFLVDAGPHYIAATRLLLGDSAKPTAVSAFTTQLQPHLPSVDTINAIWHTEPGASGTFAISFGSTLSGSEYTVACEQGSVSVRGSKVTVRMGEEKEGRVEETEFENEGPGVKQEVAAWAQSTIDGVPNPRQAPEQALADLEILEKMLRSGEEHGKTENLQYQI